VHIPDSPHLILLIALDAGVGILHMATMKQTRKKKRVSKHVLQAQEARKVDRPTNAVDLPVPTQDEPKKISEYNRRNPRNLKQRTRLRQRRIFLHGNTARLVELGNLIKILNLG
jgi:hypothetical protein